MKKFEDIELINYVINNGATLKEAANHFDVSIETIKKRIKTIKSGLEDNSEIIEKLKSISDQNVSAGRKKGGESKNSGRVRGDTLETIANQAMIILVNDFTFEDAASYFGIPSSTLYDHLELLNCDEYREIYNDLKSMYAYHHQNRVSSTILDIEERRVNKNSEWLTKLQSSSDVNFESLRRKYAEKLKESGNLKK